MFSHRQLVELYCSWILQQAAWESGCYCIESTQAWGMCLAVKTPQMEDDVIRLSHPWQPDSLFSALFAGQLAVYRWTKHLTWRSWEALPHHFWGPDLWLAQFYHGNVIIDDPEILKRGWAISLSARIWSLTSVTSHRFLKFSIVLPKIASVCLPSLAFHYSIRKKNELLRHTTVWMGVRSNQLVCHLPENITQFLLHFPVPKVLHLNKLN